MFGNYSPANLNRQSSAGKNKAGKYPDRHFTTGKHKTGKAKTGNRIFPVKLGLINQFRKLGSSNFSKNPKYRAVLKS